MIYNIKSACIYQKTAELCSIRFNMSSVINGYLIWLGLGTWPRLVFKRQYIIKLNHENFPIVLTKQIGCYVEYYSYKDLHAVCLANSFNISYILQWISGQILEQYWFGK